MTAIDDKYAALGGSSGFLGNPTTPENVAPDGTGHFRHYDGGSIYWHPSTGAYEVHGAIRDKWASLGWETCPFLGYPTTDETGTPDGVGRFNHFQNGGSIYWTPSTGAWEVHGAIRRLWEQLGWETSPLGYPISDEMDTPRNTGRVSQFQHGAIYWDPRRGAYEVYPRPNYPAPVPAQRGQWEIPAYSSGAVGMHAALLDTNQVLFFAYLEPTDEAVIENPVPGDFGESSVLNLWDHALHTPAYHGIGGTTQMPNIFCSGHALMADGRLLVAGGDREDQTRIRSVHVVTPDGAGGSWQYVGQLDSGRWYPSAVTLPDGRVLVVGGEKRIAGDATFNRSYQIYDPGSGVLEPEVAAPPLAGFGSSISFPFTIVLPTGKLLIHGGTHSVFLDLTSMTFDATTAEAAARPDRQSRTYGVEGTAVLLPLLPDATPPYHARVMAVGGGGPNPVSIRTDATASCEILDAHASPPSWQIVAPLAHARVMPDAVLLPDGKVLVMNGSSRGASDNGANPVWEAELYDPAANTWTTMAEMSIPRLYHATALLLPDGRVMTAGTDILWNPDPFHDSERRVEVFSPPYLFQGPRPTIASAPDTASYGQQFTVHSPDAATVDAAALVRCGSTTHSFNSDQRYVGLRIVGRTDETLTLEAPPDGNVAPPGAYMLFLLRDGVPSVGHFVGIQRSIFIDLGRFLHRVWWRRWIRDPRSGVPMPFPPPPDWCPQCEYVFVDPGEIVTIDAKDGAVRGVGITGGELRTFALRDDTELETKLRVEKVDTHGRDALHEARQGIAAIRKNGGSVRGLVLDNGRVRALIGGVGEPPAMDGKAARELEKIID